MRYIESENPFIWSRFTTGDSVTITIYKAADDSVVVNAVPMSALAATGYFKYQFNPTITELTEYFYIATNGTEEHAGKIILGGYPDTIKDQTDKIDDLHKLQGLDLSNSMTVTPSSREVGTIKQTISGDGTTTSTVTRTA